MATINETRKNQQNELAELQAEYAEKRKRIAKDKEREINNLEESYQNKKEHTQTQGAAAINHIRERSAEDLAKAVSRRSEMNAKHNEKLQQVEEKYKTTLNQTQLRKQQELTKLRDESQQQIQQLEAQSRSRINTIQQANNEEIRKIREQHQNEIEKVVSHGSQSVEQIRTDNQEHITSERERAQAIRDKLNAKHQEQFTELKARHDKQINDEKSATQRDIAKINSEYEKEYDKTVKHWNERENRLNQEYSQKLSHNKEEKEKMLKQQNQRFQSVYQKNELAQKRSLTIQKEMMNREIGELKKDFIQKTENYDNKVEDPFYKIQDRGSELIEDVSHYVLRAYAPEHEKDNIKVSVHPDRVTVSGSRSFKDKINDEDEQKTVSSSTFQNFREEFKLNSPVNTKGLTREREGDYITFIIPKLGSPQFSRKA
ncbi:MAG: hypothetical protein ACLGGX_02420 [Bdellovibrionia bacterium]